MIRNLAELAAEVSAGEKTIESVSHRIYKGTDCGAWVAERTVNGSPGIGIGSIVEGVDQCTQVQELAYPFTSKQFWAAVQAVENEADEIWKSTHGCPYCWNGDGDNVQEDEETGDCPVDPDCKHCKGQGQII